jgi:2-polyprenyl-6-methoxyphenol hydroxylase-like FAD-dependent oxidoreductase
VAQGISDAFRDAELCATAVDATLGGAPAGQAMGDYQAARDRAAAPMYAYTLQLARLQPTPELQELVGAIHGDREGMDDFARTYAGTISPDEFFAPANVEAILSAAARRAEPPPA